MWAMQVDLDHLAKGYGLNHHGSKHPCVLCRADCDQYKWTDWSPVAAWRSTVLNHEDWKAAQSSLHPLFTLPLVGPCSIIPDVLHIMHLGVYSYFLGSVIKLLTHYTMPANKQRNLDVLMSRIKKYYSDNKTPCTFNNITITMCDRGVSQFPMLKGKGADIKHLVYAMEHVFADMMCPTNLQHKTIKSMLGHLVQIEEVFHEHKDLYALPGPTAKKVGQLADRFAERLTGLPNYYHQQGILLFHYTIKMH